MGARSGVWAIDPDPPKKPEEPDGREIWASLLQEHGKPPPTHTEVTPRDGQHIFFKWDPDRPVTNSPGALAKTNVDIRGEGGYVIVAPSVCIGDGSAKNVAGQYCVAKPLDFFHFATAPDWLYGLILKKPEPQPAPKPEQTATVTPLRPSRAPNDGKQFWRKVNDIAFQTLAAWVPDIFGSAAEYQPNTGAWRVSSRALGRDNDEDLSISPLGGKDWGVWDIGDARQGKRTAIDIVMEHGNAPDAEAAAFWLCERCGVDPAALGWSEDGGRNAELFAHLFASSADETNEPEEAAEAQEQPDESDPEATAEAAKGKRGRKGSGATIGDFYAYMPRHTYIFVPTREMWPESSVNSRLPKVPLKKMDGTPVVDENGNRKSTRPSVWLDKHRPVEQMTWAPGEPLTIDGKLIAEGGWFERPGATTFNLYRPPAVRQGNSANADRWVELVERVYLDDAQHIITFCAHRIQYPAVKINHGLILGGGPGIGKDTMLEPLKLGVGRGISRRSHRRTS
jgi:hypothetical protein